jgi:antitoxin MazE
MRTVVKKWGNSAAIRIPSNVLKAAKIEIDDVVDIREEQGRVIVRPLRPNSYDLAHLVEGITPDNLHDEVDFGSRRRNFFTSDR